MTILRKEGGEIMNLDFHYYGTYVAARLAGYDFNSAQTIAHSAQYVDDSDESMLKDSLGNYYIKDFTPNPTVQSLADMMTKNFLWSEGSLKSIADIWIPFHFLPANYGENGNIIQYTGPKSDRGTMFSWEFDSESAKEFKLLCQPNSLLVKSMINDIITNHTDKDYTLEMAGLRMHVLADSWAHMYYIGIPAWFVNNAGETVYQIDGHTKTEVKWQRVWPWADSTDIIAGESATPNMLAYNSVVYLGHGRMGHLPDYPWLKYQYRPQWSNSDITKDNTTYFLQGLKQLTKALNCIKNKTPFDINSYADLPADVENVINEILGTKVNDQCETWRNNINRIIVDGEPLQVPEVYDKNKWLDSIKGHSDIKNSSYYYFNKSSSFHLDLVRDILEANNINIDSTPRENIVKVKFKNKKGNYIGKMYKQVEYYPKMASTGITLEIIKPTPTLLKSGDIVEIKTNEPEVGSYNFLGAWQTTALYYYKRAYSVSKQKWQIEKVDTSGNQNINAGDQVRFKNMYYENKPYMATYKYWAGGTYLTTQSNGSADNAIWIMDGLTEFNMYIITPDYFVSNILNQETSNMIYTAMNDYGMLEPTGKVKVDTLRNALETIGLGFIPKPLEPAQKEQVLIQLYKLVN